MRPRGGGAGSAVDMSSSPAEVVLPRSNLRRGRMRFGPRSLTPWTWKGANPTMSGHLVRRGLQPLAWAVPFLLGFVLLGPAATSARAQTGTITGKITDEKGDPAPFIAVGLNGTQMGAQSNREGKFTFIKGPVGTYTM